MIRPCLHPPPEMAVVPPNGKVLGTVRNASTKIELSGHYPAFSCHLRNRRRYIQNDET